MTASVERKLVPVTVRENASKPRTRDTESRLTTDGAETCTFKVALVPPPPPMVGFVILMALVPGELVTAAGTVTTTWVASV
jgi:hypothetical protein